MVFAQFYDKALTSDNLIEVCGDRGIIYLDGRESLFNQIEVCDRYANERNYPAYKILTGETMNRNVIELHNSLGGKQ